MLLLQVDLGGLLESGPSEDSSLVYSAAVRAGLVDAMVNQMLSAVERVKSEVEQPPPSNTGQQQQQVTRPTGSWLQCFAATVTSVAGLALAPLTAWQAQQQQQPLQRRKSLPQRLLSLGSAGHAEEQVQQQWPGSGAGSGGGSSSIVTGSTDGAVDSAQDLVGVDGNGQPFAGLCNPVSRCFEETGC